MGRKYTECQYLSSVQVTYEKPTSIETNLQQMMVKLFYRRERCNFPRFLGDQIEKVCSHIHGGTKLYFKVPNTFERALQIYETV